MSSLLSLTSNQLTVPATKPRKTTKATTPPIVEEAFTVAPTNHNAVEGFTAPVTRSFPVYTGPSIYFKRSMMDIFYNKYDDDNIKPNPDIVSLLSKMEVAPPELPNYGSMLANFDAGSIANIPWDSDNATYLQSDIVWGQVTADASKSIFMKAYHAALLSDPENVDTGGEDPLFNSAIFPISTSDPGTALFLQVSDAVAGVAGQMAVTYAYDKLVKQFKKANVDVLLNNAKKQQASLVAKLDDAKYKSSVLGKLDDFITKTRGLKENAALTKLNQEIAELEGIKNNAALKAEAAAIEAKKKAKITLTPAEELTKAASAADDAKKGAAVAADGVKSPTKLSTARFKLKGPKAALKFVNKLAGKFQAYLTKKLTEFSTKFLTKRVTIWSFLGVMQAVASIAAAVTGGIMAWLPILISQMLVAYGWLDAICQVLTMVLMVLLPSLLDKALANGGVCGRGKPIDQIITDEFLYFIFATFTPVGSLMDVFGPYVCYNPDGSAHMKEALFIPPYFADSSLSISKHAWSPTEIPRGDSTSFESRVPSNWPIVGGIAREPCQAGTWTSSDVDMLCNISTYVPKTYPKRSMVPPTVVKGSKVPTTHVKQTFVATYVKDSVREVRLPTYRRCPDGQRDTSLTGGIGDCWDDLKCKTQCWGDWNPTHWGCNTSCTGCGCIPSGGHFYDREECPSGFTKYLSLCRSNCPQGKTATLQTDLFCTGTCAPDETTWLAFCTGNTDAWCNSHVPSNKSGSNWKNVAGVCWSGCSATQVDVGALCRDKCRDDQNEVLGVCWDKCAPNTIDIGALCRTTCSGDTPHDVAGVCWGGCASGHTDVGALCREGCTAGFNEVAGVCWGNIGTYARKSMVPSSVKKYDPGYNPPGTKEQLSIPWCDFAQNAMLDRMAQFYYDQSTLHPQQLEDGRISYEYIVQFYGVKASSELSCDVACQIKTVVFDPVTGGRYEETLGTTYPDDPGNQVSYRRFYFIHINAATATLLAAQRATNPAMYTKEWTADPPGMFTVTGCTNSDNTAPDAMGYSTDSGVDPLLSVPKIFEVRDKNRNPVQFSEASFATSLATTAATTLIGAVPPLRGSKKSGVKINKAENAQPSMGQQVAGAVAGGLAGQALTMAINKAMNVKVPVGAAVENAVVGPVSGSIEAGNAIFAISTENDNFSINHGPIYECRARDNNGYFPNITFCGKVNTTELLCSHPLVLRDTIDLYHSQNPEVHIKTVNAIEPRGKDGCYYKFNTTTYDDKQNLEGNVTTVEEVVLKYQQNDKSTCVFTPTSTFIRDMSSYPVRSYYDVNTKSMVYPTRKVNSTATVQGRYVRIRPSLNGDGYMRLSQIAVYDSTETNLALSRPVYTNAPAYTGSGPPNAIVDGTLACRSAGEGVWIGGGNKQSIYIDIDLGQNYYINYVVFYGQLDIETPANDMGIRIEILYSNRATEAPQKQLLTKTTNRVEIIDFSTQMILPKLPVKPFEVPRPLPPETNLGGCASRCEDKNQIEEMIKTYNTSNSTSQIIKVTKAFTPTATRCDYEAEIVSKEGTDKMVSKKNISFTVGSKVTNPASIIYGRYVRVNAIPDPDIAGAPMPNPLRISQIVITNAAGKNVALKKKTFATINDIKSMNAAAYGISSLVTDGNAMERQAPDHWSSGIYSDMSIMVDLGISHDIASITIYGVAGTNYAGAVVQVLTSANENATPVYSETLASGRTTFTLSNFPACKFTYTQATPAFTYIQDSTPLLDSVDTSGGVLSFKGISDSIVGIFNSIINPIKLADPLGVLNRNVDTANTAVNNIALAAAANLQIEGCPNTKCNDPAILTSIANSYNTGNTVVTTQYGAETNTMTQITKAGVSGPKTCDVMFTNLYKAYDDFLYPPSITENTTMVKRFTMTNTGNCVLKVTPGSSAIDLSSNAVGIIPPSSALTSPFKITPCQVNCRDPAIIASLKTRLNSTTTGGVTNFTAIMQSFANGGSTCEYYMTKDVSKQNSAKKITTDKGLYTYVTANMTVNPSNCSFTLGSVSEADPERITARQDPVTGLMTASLNGAPINLPYLFNYDNTQPSSLVNETPLNL